MSIKDFSIINKLGEGAYSSVYKVQRLADHKQYALKKVKLANLSQKQLQNAINQVRILASVSVPNIVSYKQAFLQGKNLCLVMEFADGGDLYQRITENKKNNKIFEQSQIWNILIQISRGLKTLHDAKIFHRDLKSANVFLTKEGVAKLGDMNVSKLAKNGLLYTENGTPYYASPEVWKDKPYDSKSDIWSFGCVIYEMTSLDPPFKADDMEGLFGAVTTGKYPPIPSNYSRQLASVIKLMLQQNPLSRPSCDKLLKSALLIKKSKQLNIEYPVESIKFQLLKTIRIPKKIHSLTDSLPKSNYQSIKSLETNLQSSYERNPSQILDRKSTLPRLEGAQRYHEDLGTKKQAHQKKRKDKKSRNSLALEEPIKSIQINYDLSINLSKEKQEMKDYLKRIHCASKNKHNIVKGLPQLKR